MTSPPRGRRTTTRSKTQILFLVQNVAYDNKFMSDYEVVKDQLPEERHLAPTKLLHPKKMTVQTGTEEAALIPDKEDRPSLHQTSQDDGSGEKKVHEIDEAGVGLLHYQAMEDRTRG